MTTAKEKEEAKAEKDEAAARKETENKLLEPFEASNVKVEGELLQGDSFRINVTRGNLTMHIPVPVEGTNNTNTLSNAFKLVEEALKVKNEKEMREKFGSLIA